MVEYSLLDVPAVESPDDPQWGWVFAAMARLDEAVSNARFGNSDLVEPAQMRFAQFNNQQDDGKVLKLAIPGSGPDLRMAVGYAWADLPLSSNTGKAEFEVVVHPEWTEINVGHRLLVSMEEHLARLGRKELILFTGFGPADDQEPYETSPQGGQQPTSIWNAKLALSHGYELSLVEKMSVLDLPMDTAAYKAMMTDAVVRSAGYRVHSWTGDIPGEWAEKYARLRGKFGVLAPSGMLSWDEDVWDEARVQRHDQAIRDMGRVSFLSIAEEIVSGDLVGFTEISVPLAVPSPVGFQDITMVLPTHQGHRLGRLLKLFNLSRLQMERSDVKRIYTWNAAENAHMLGINIAMGFRPFGGSGNWVKRK
ncbi:MAG: hypothetical protein LBN10_01595 [Propionibacteriaceae bacterium]|jgi:GNAT superfamily N-acetyltransferase|nr:hypothetical protein [Propionibacteriaceae bacterium]